MIKFFLFFLMATWPVLQLIKTFSLQKNLFHVDLLKPFVLVLAVLALFVLMLQRKKPKFGSPFLLWLIYYGYILSNFYFNGSDLSLLRTFTEQYNISMMPLMLYFVILNFGGDFDREGLVYSLIICGLIIAGIGLAEASAGSNLIGEVNYEGVNVQSVYRTNGPFQEGIGYSTIVLLFIPFAYFYFKEGLISKYLYFFLFLFFSAGFLVTLSRASMIAYFIILIILVSAGNVKAIFINLYLSVIIAILAYFSWEWITASELYAKRFADTSNIMGRWSQYKECLDIFLSRPLMGIGSGFYKKNHLYYIHNTYLKHLVELGLLGFLFHIFFIFSVAFSNFKESFMRGGAYMLKCRLSFIVILLFVPNTIDLLTNQYFMLTLFCMIAVLNLNPVKNQTLSLPGKTNA